ncbi:hypothetical protein CYLTODRAFT_419421 [Cylindrobasidium torrendii FP15055 ss-10]|uniref:Uncharacterized protein n=1 Tax=Cylindrobasidium torrendii FP15055 ss-10 TaxID=1314674 RepID=A0A0D7BJN5_9AGAR|nr:hypothetical protein CYLTODRAFT_419421 [Cylindrobasidium torrendii FP15055 ss-10]
MDSTLLNTLPLPPSALSALDAAGYETLGDLRGLPREQLEEYGIPSSMMQAIGASQAPARAPPLSQSIASMTQGPTKETRITTGCQPLDVLLSGGLPFGTALEISGPPGAPREPLAMNICKSFVRAQKRVLFVDFQNMHSPASIRDTLSDIDYDKRSVLYSKILDLSHLMQFVHSLPGYLERHPPISLLVLSSISNPFQNAHVAAKNKIGLQSVIRAALAKACVSQEMTVVSTSQLSTKVLNADGSVGNYDTGAKGVMVPSLGDYLPEKKSYRVIVSRSSPNTGELRLFSTPVGPGTVPHVEYSFDDL